MIREISISQFKAHCLEIINKLQNGNEEVVITKRHKPVAKVQSFNQSGDKSILGMMQGRAEIKGDIVSAINENWNAEQ